MSRRLQRGVMIDFLTRMADFWISRHAARDPKAVARIGDKRPAVVITGASRGIGLALARRAAKDKRAVVLVARHLGPCRQAADAIAAEYPSTVAVPLALDITEPAAFAQIEAALEAHALYLDVLINNAGMGLGGAMTSHSVEDLDRLTQLNIGAVTRLTRHALPQMIARGRGGIINVASLGGYVPGPYQAAYYASKAYVLSLTEAVAYECAGLGVRICAVAPGPVETGFHEDMGAETAFYRDLLPALSPERVAAAIWWQFKLGKRVVIPGILPMVGMPALRILPHMLSVPLIGWLLKPRNAGNCDKSRASGR